MVEPGKPPWDPASRNSGMVMTWVKVPRLYLIREDWLPKLKMRCH